MSVIPWQSGASPSILFGSGDQGVLASVTGQDPTDAATDYSEATANPLGGAGNLMDPVLYGGYAGGAGDTAGYLAALQQAAATQGAPQANFGQANQYMGNAYTTGLAQNQNLAAMRSQLGGLEKEASGQGTTAADRALSQGMRSGQAADQSLAKSAGPGAAWSGAQREAAGAQSLATAQGAAAMTQQKYQEQMAAQQQLMTAQQGYQGALAAARGNALGGAQAYAGMEQFNPGLAQQQGFLNAGQQGVYEGDILNLNTTVQGAEIQQGENEMNYGLAEQGNQMQQSAITNSAIMGGAGGGLTALGSAIQSNQQPTNPYGYG